MPRPQVQFNMSVLAPHSPSGTQASYITSAWFPRAWWTNNIIQGWWGVELGFELGQSDSRVWILNHYTTVRTRVLAFNYIYPVGNLRTRKGGDSLGSWRTCGSWCPGIELFFLRSEMGKSERRSNFVFSTWKWKKAFPPKVCTWNKCVSAVLLPSTVLHKYHPSKADWHVAACGKGGVLLNFSSPVKMFFSDWNVLSWK